MGSNAAALKGSALIKLAAAEAMAARLPVVTPSIARWDAGKQKIKMPKSVEIEYTNRGPGLWKSRGVAWYVNTQPLGELAQIFFTAAKNEAGWCRAGEIVAVNGKCKLFLEFEPLIAGQSYRGAIGALPGLTV